MKIYLIDYDGNEVMNLTLFQYDAGQKIHITEVGWDQAKYPINAPTVHFWNDESQTVIATIATLVNGNAGAPDAVWSAEIPNSLLQSASPCHVAVYLQAASPSQPSKTAWSTTIQVIPRISPDYEINTDDDEPMTAAEIFRLLGDLDSTDTSYVQRFNEQVAAAQLAAIAAQHGLDDDADSWLPTFKSSIANMVLDEMESVNGVAY